MMCLCQLTTGRIRFEFARWKEHVLFCGEHVVIGSANGDLKFCRLFKNLKLKLKMNYDVKTSPVPMVEKMVCGPGVLNARPWTFARVASINNSRKPISTLKCYFSVLTWVRSNLCRGI